MISINAAAHILIALMAIQYAPKTEFDARLTIYEGCKNEIWAYRITNASVTVTRCEKQCKTGTVVFQRDLQHNEMKKMEKFFAGYPLDSMQKRYIPGRVNSDTCYVYYIVIKKSGRTSYVLHGRPRELLELNRAFNRVLPRRYHLWDEKL